MNATPSSLTANMAAISRPNFIGSVKDEWELYSDNPLDYTIGAPIGFGASSIVYAAKFHHKGSSHTTPCALKVVDLERLPPHALSLLQRETTLMSLSKHPNVLRVRGSWMDGHKLYIALRLMNKGSAADVMRYGWPGGMDEDVVRCILQQALQGLNYLHINGFIHRDIKAANLLIDDDGTVLLGDLGVSANLAEPSENPTLSTSRPRPQTRTTAAILSPPRDNGTHSSTGSGKRVVILDPSHPSAKPKIGKRKSFVGTPCWMAPELIQGHNYDSSADIWSFGITALELTQGRPPRSRDPPQKVLMRTIQDDPPTLNRDGGPYKYSKAFKDVIDSCLVKDPSKRPTAEQLLQTPFFRASKKKSYLVGAILKDLPPLTHRQERRAVASIHLRTVDSWDFTTTIAESVQSYHQRRLNDVPPPGVFEMSDDDGDSGLDEEIKPSPLPPNKSQHILPHSSFDPGFSSESSSPSGDTGTGSSLSSRSSSPSLSTPPSSEPSSSVNGPPSKDLRIFRDPATSTIVAADRSKVISSQTAMASPSFNTPSTNGVGHPHLNNGSKLYSPRQRTSTATGQHHAVAGPTKRPSTSTGASHNSIKRPSTSTGLPESNDPRRSSMKTRRPSQIIHESESSPNSHSSFWRKLTKRDSKIVLQPAKTSTGREDDVSGGNGVPVHMNVTPNGTIRGKTAKVGSLFARAGNHLATAAK